MVEAIKLTKLVLKFYASGSFHLCTNPHIYLWCTVCSDLKQNICNGENSHALSLGILSSAQQPFCCDGFMGISERNKKQASCI